MSEYNHEEKKEIISLADEIIDIAKEIKSNAIDIEHVADRGNTMSVSIEVMRLANELKKAIGTLP